MFRWLFVFILAFSMSMPALAQRNNQEFRAVWVITWEYINPGWSASKIKYRIRTILDNVKAANMNAVLWQVRQSGTVYFNSSYEPWGYYSNYYNYPGFDPLEYAIQEAHKRGLELHAWFNTFQTYSTHPGTPAYEHPEWVNTNEDGQFMPKYKCVSPGLEAVREYTVKVAMEIVRNYDIDGLHLDYVRWNEFTDDDMASAPASEIEQMKRMDGMITEEQFNKLMSPESGKRYIYDVEHPASGGVPAGFNSWDDWRRWSVTEFVRTLHDSIQAVKPWVRLSPAALGKYNWSGWNGYYVVFQDAALWFNEGYVDQLTPMHYHWTSGDGFYQMLTANCPACWEQWITGGIVAGRLYTVGPGSYRLDEDNVWDNHPGIVESSREVEWTDGFQFFSYASWEKHNYWETAAQTFFKKKTKIRPTKLVVDTIPAAPTLSLTKIDSMNYDVHISPPYTLDSPRWFAIYRSLDSTLDVSNDQLIALQFSDTAFTYRDSYWGQEWQEGRYTYFATMLDRYWNESDVSNAETGDSIPYYVNPPVQAPEHVIAAVQDANNVTIFCDPVENADQYIALISQDGVNFTDTVVAYTNIIEVHDLTEGQPYYFKLKAANSAGETPLTKRLYGVVPSSNATQVLLVNGFDRGTNTRYDYVRFYAPAIANRGYGFDYVMNESVIEGKIALTDYDVVIWILGDESTADETFSSTEQEKVKEFLKQGGHLFVSGSEIGWDLDKKGSSTDRSFYRNYLKAIYAADAPDGRQGTYYSCQADPNGIFAGLPDFSFDNGTHGTFDVDWPDALTPYGGSRSILKYKNATSTNIAGIVFEGKFTGGSVPGKLVYIAVPFETIYPEGKRSALMSKVFDFFEGQITDIALSEEVVPTQFQLKQNYPNPFNGITTIEYALPRKSRVQLTVYDALGRRIRTLVDEEQAPGTYRVSFQADGLASGVYYYILQSGGQRFVRQMVLVK